MKMAFFFHHFVLLLIVFSCTAESFELWNQYCSDNYMINTTQLSRNIGSLLPKLVSGAITNGFITTSVGKSKDQIYGLAQCRGDVSRRDCSACIQDAAGQIRQLCPYQADARVWYDYCFLRYSTQEFAGEEDTSFGVVFYNVDNVTDPDYFHDKLDALSDKISSEAVQPTNKGLGRGKSDLAPFQTLYALAQCTRDLSPLACAQCLATAFDNFGTICNDKKGCRVLYSSCMVRYELYPFFFSLAARETLVHVPLKNYASVYKH